MIGQRLGSPVLLVALAVLAASFAAGCGGAGAPTGGGAGAPTGGVATGPGETAAGALSASPAPTIAATPIETPASTSTPIASMAHTPEETAMPFTLTSPAFAEGGPIPSRYTCDGRDLSPPLAWSGAPDGTASLALIVDDPDARGFVHWVAFGIEGGAAGTLAEGISTAAGAPAQGRNDFRRTGYGGPCPPSGTHRYDFTLYALDTRLALSGSPTAAEVRSAMSGHVLARATLRGTYRR